MFGYSEKPPAIQCGGTHLGRIGDAIHQILSYVATPMAMPMLCAVAHFVYSACWRQEAWAGVVVDTRRIRPAGRKANSLWQKWIAAKAVISGAWATNNVGVIVPPRVAVWRWGPQVQLDGLSVLVSQGTVTSSITMLLEYTTGCAAICFSSTNDPQLIASNILEGNETDHTFLGVLFKPDTAILYRSCVALCTVAIRHMPHLLTLSVVEKQLEVGSPDILSYATDLGDVSLPAGCYVSFVWDGECRAYPCWGKRNRHICDLAPF